MIVAALPEQARAWIVERAAVSDRAENPFARTDWVTHLFDCVSEDHWRFLLGEVNGSALSLLFASAPHSRAWRGFTNYYASLYTPFVGTVSAAARDQLVRELAAVRPAPESVDLSPLSTEDADATQAAFRAGGWITRRYDCFGNWYLPCDGLGFDAYMAARPTQLLNTWRRRSRKFSTAPSPGESGRLQLVTSPAEVAAAMQAYGQVYAKSWKGHEPYPSFVPGWARICAERGWLRLGLAWWGDVPVAAQFWFTIGRRAYIFKLAYDESFAKLSAGTVLSAFLFKQALDVDRVEEIDYLTGDDEYKRAWVTHRRPRVGVVACNPRTWRGALRAGTEMAGLVRKRLLGTTHAAMPQPIVGAGGD